MTANTAAPMRLFPHDRTGDLWADALVLAAVLVACYLLARRVVRR